jgi:hypothetical protein
MCPFSHDQTQAAESQIGMSRDWRPVHGTIVSIVDDQRRALPGGVVAPAAADDRSHKQQLTQGEH